ncbi:MAG: hypothetical protein HOV87_00930 [Catenulispora sp.]|nr:hypothetical protein [Catenulispora sp.]
MGELVAAEAAIVAEIFDRFVEGASLRSIAQDLNARGVPTSTGKSWSVGGIGRIVDAPRYAGLRVRHGEVVAGRTAVWPPCVDVDVWERARALRRGAGQERPRHVYLLTGLVVCAVCGGHMVGSSVNGYRVYACAGHLPSSPGHRRRYISADNLEGQVVEQALVMLEGWEAEDARTVPIASPYEVPDPSANSTAPRALIVIRSAAAMDGVVIGPGARFAWNRLSAEHKAAVLRFLFTVIRIGPSTKPRPVFDAGRADIVPAVLRRP